MPNDLALPPVTMPHPDVPVSLDKHAFARVAAVALVEAEEDVARLEDALRLAKQHLDYVARVEVPEAFGDAQVEKIAVDDSIQVVLEHRVHCRIAEAKRPAVLAWCKAQHFTAMLTCTVSVEFKREEYGIAQEAMAALRAFLTARGKADRAIEEQWGVPAPTLKKFVGDYLKAGNPHVLPDGLDYFNDPAGVVKRLAAEAPRGESNPLA